MYFCKFRKIYMHIFLTEHLWATASVRSNIPSNLAKFDIQPGNFESFIIECTVLKIQFRPVKCATVTRIRKNFEQRFFPSQSV